MKDKAVRRIHWATKMVNGMDHLIHLKKRDQQQKILVGQFVHVVDVYKFNGEMARRAYGKGV